MTTSRTAETSADGLKMHAHLKLRTFPPHQLEKMSPDVLASPVAAQLSLVNSKCVYSTRTSKEPNTFI